MNYKTMTIEQLEARKSEIALELDKPEANLDALETEARAIKEEMEARKATEAKKNAVREMVGNGAGVASRSFAADVEERSYDASSPEYRSAFLKNLLGAEMTKEERAAFVHTTENTANAMPVTMLNRIWDLISTQHSILGDVTVYRTGTVIEVVKHTGISAGDAKVVAENAANDDEQNTFVKVTLSGKDFSKHVDISYAMERMSIDSLESYLVSEISSRIGAAMAVDVVAQIGNDMESDNNLTSAKDGELSFADLAKAFGKLDRADNIVVYTKRGTLYNYLVGMVDAAGRPVFQTTAQAGAAGTVIGATIKIEDAVAANTLLIGDPSKVVYNMVQDIMIESAKDIKKHVTTYSGYARGGGALVVPTAFAKLTVQGG